MMAETPKVLFCATVARHIKAFHIPSLKFLKEKGFEIHVAANCIDEVTIPYVDKFHPISIARKPFKIENITAYYQLKRIINEFNFEIIHYHIPVSAAVGRLASRNARKKGTIVIYTAHGFNFFQGSPLLNWILYFPIEKYLAKHTDCLITINNEDFSCIKKHRFLANSLEKINGMGVNISRFSHATEREKKLLREKYGFKSNDFILIYSAEFSKRKNQEWLISILPEIRKQIPNIHLLLPGVGDTQNDCRELSKRLKVDDIVTMPGFRTDIEEMIKLSDVGVSASRNEGLGIHLIEDMACGKPIIATNLQGHKDLIKDNYNGFLIDISRPREIIQPLVNLYNNKDLYNQMSMNSLERSKMFSLDVSIQQLMHIYNRYIGDRSEYFGSLHTKSFNFDGHI